jgi:hypothetical protein
MSDLISTVRRGAALAVLAALCSCSDSPTDPDGGASTSLSAVLLEASDPLLADLSSGVLVGPVTMTSIMRFTPGGCTYDAGTQSFICAASSSGGLSVERSFILFDAAGNRQSQFSPTSTASVQTRMRVSGTMTSANSRLTVDDTDERIVSGLLTARHVLNGASKMTMTGSLATPGAPAEPFTMSSTTKTENLTLPSSSNRWPGPGTMTMVSTSSFADMADELMTSVVKVTFTGTKCVTIETRSGDQVYTSTIDLSNPNAASCTP